MPADREVGDEDDVVDVDDIGAGIVDNVAGVVSVTAKRNSATYCSDAKNQK